MPSLSEEDDEGSGCLGRAAKLMRTGESSGAERTVLSKLLGCTSAGGGAYSAN